MKIYKVGQKVRAVDIIYDRNDGSPDDPVRATAGDLGTVEHVDEEGYPTVRFERTGGATIVHPDEIKEE